MKKIMCENNSTILIQNYYGCNLHCSVCAYHSTPVKGVRMPDEIFALVRHRLIEFDKCMNEYRVVPKIHAVILWLKNSRNLYYHALTAF